MKLAICWMWGLLLCFSALPAQELAYYLPEGQAYNPRIPTPAQVLGFEVGAWHVTHDQQLRYLERLAAVSPRLRLDTIGYTYERRPLVHLIITAERHHGNLEAIRQAHVSACDPRQPAPTAAAQARLPVVVWMGYSIHGNEASGGQAALVVAYHLAAAQGPAMDSLLEQAVILLDPCFNPDGFQRFSSWVNSHRSLGSLDALPESREHREAWPGGRTNHYWFDLNRDWLPAQHPESQARLARFHAWKPHILTDHHEMGRNSTFFFQPGVPARNHPLTPDTVFALTHALARYHARALDAIGSLYYTEEGFDDFYYGKGSTYPDINGGVGILFEQASVRGHLVETDNGPLSFPFAIRNQVQTSLSTLAGAQGLRSRLRAHQRRFYEESLAWGSRQDTAAWLVPAGPDPARLEAFRELMVRHQVELRALPPGAGWPTGGLVIDLAQPQARLIRAMFEQRTQFRDSIFYDISAWTLPLAFGLEAQPLKRRELLALGNLSPASPAAPGRLHGTPGSVPYAWAFGWEGYYAPRTLDRLLAAGLRARVATQPFEGPDGQVFARGTIVVPAQEQVLPAPAIAALLDARAQADFVQIYPLATGLTAGVNLGSNRFRPLQRPRVILVVGEGVSAYEAGEAWHLLDYRFGLAVSLVSAEDLGRVPLHDFTALVMVGGNYGQLSLPGERLRDWLAQGGTLIATKTALNWLKREGLGRVELIRNPDPEPGPLPYGNKENLEGAQAIGGAICAAEWDLTHPLAFGYQQPKVSLLRNSRIVMESSDDPFGTPLRYTQAPLQSGYISAQNLERLAGTAVVNVAHIGQGHIVSITDNPNFRAFWYGTNKLFLNAIFFSQVIE